MKINTLKAKTYNFLLKEVNSSDSYCGNFKVLKLRKTNREVSLPTNFEVLTLNSTRIELQKVLRVGRGDLIAIPRRLLANNFYQHLKIEDWGGRNVKLPKLLTEDLAYFLGLVASDGHIRKDAKIAFTNTNKTLLKTFDKLVKKLFKLKTGNIFWKERRKNKIYRWSIKIIYSKALKEYLMNNFELKEGNKNIYLRVPRCIWNSPKAVIASYLKGVYDGDGSLIIGKENIALRLVAKNKDFAYDIQDLLLFFGIISSVGKTKRGLWEVKVTNRANIKRFKEIGFVHTIKSQKLIESTKNYDLTFMKIGRLIKEMRERTGISVKKLANKLGLGASTIQNYEEDVCLPKPMMLKKIAVLLDSEKLLSCSTSKSYKESCIKRRSISGIKKTTNIDVLNGNIAKRVIKELKKKYKVSQTDIAKSIGSSQGRIGNYERGMCNISHERVVELNKKFPTKFGSTFADYDIFWDVVDSTKNVKSQIKWPNLKGFIYYNKIIARRC